MRIVHRLIQQIAPGKWGQVLDWDAKYGAIEQRYGVPPYRRYRAMVGADGTDTLVSEQEWESMAAFEERYTKAIADPDWEKLDAEAASVITSGRHEFYLVLK